MSENEFEAIEEGVVYEIGMKSKRGFVHMKQALYQTVINSRL